MISKALIPVAGKGTRLLPLTSVVPKALFALVDGAGRIKSALHVICEQAMQAGVSQIGVVVSPWQKDMICRYFAAVESDFAKLGPANQVEGWKDYAYITRITTDSTGEVWIGVGINVLWETYITYYIDDMAIELKPVLF